MFAPAYMGQKAGEALECFCYLGKETLVEAPTPCEGQETPGENTSASWEKLSEQRARLQPCHTGRRLMRAEESAGDYPLRIQSRQSLP
jgi:hypothetical protein